MRNRHRDRRTPRPDESASPLKLASIALILVGVIGLNLSGVTPEGS
jgi:preprotein translocase subunit Sss1